MPRWAMRRGSAGREFDDSGWRRLDLPHDWAVERPLDPNKNISQGYRRFSVSNNRKCIKPAALNCRNSKNRVAKRPAFAQARFLV